MDDHSLCFRAKPSEGCDQIIALLRRSQATIAMAPQNYPPNFARQTEGRLSGIVECLRTRVTAVRITEEIVALAGVPRDAERQHTIADVLKLLDADVTLSKQRRSDLRCALRAFVRFRAAPADELPALPGTCMRQLDTLQPADAGVSERRLITIRSYVAYCLKKYGRTAPVRSTAPGATEWRTIMSSLDGAERVRLRALAEWASRRALLPSDLTDEVLRDFQRDMAAEGYSLRPSAAASSARRSLEKLRQARPDLGLPRLSAGKVDATVGRRAV